MSDSQNNKSRKIRGIIILLVSFLLIAAVAGTAYAFRDYLMNSYARMTKSPAEYYAYIEKKNVAEIVDTLIPVSDSAGKKESASQAIDVSSNITINHNAMDPILKSYLGTSLTEFEELIGLPLNKIGIDAFIGTDGERSNETLTLKLNDVQVITAEVFLDFLTGRVLLSLPELSDAYLSMTDEATAVTDQAIYDQMTPEQSAEFLIRYSDIIIDHIHEVTREENTVLSLDTLSEEYTTLKVIMTAEDLYQMEMEVLDAAKEDTFLLDALSASGITQDQYLAALEDIRDEFTASKDLLEDLTMMIYVDGTGRILGRNITSEDSVAAIGYTILQERGYFEYDFYLTEDTGKTLFEVTGNHTWDAGVNNGNMNLMLVTNPETYEEFNCDVTYEDIRSEVIDQNTYRYGTITLDSLDLMGMQIILDMGVTDNVQTDTLVFQMGAESLVTIDTTTKYLNSFTPIVPEETAEIYDLDQSEGFLATFDTEGYLSRLSEQLGIDLQILFNTFLMNATDY